MCKKYLSVVVATAATVLAAFADLPSGYTELEWIESNGHQYIDTGIKAGSGLIVSGDLRLLSNDPRQALFGGADDGHNVNPLAITTRQNGEKWNVMRYHYKQLGSYTTGSSTSIGIGTGRNLHSRMIWKCSNGTFSVGGSTSLGLSTLSAKTYTSTNNIYIAWMSGPNGGSTSNIKAALMIYGFSIQKSSDSSYYRNFVPAIRDSDGEVGMLDTVNEVFYGSLGDRPFKAGPRVSSVYPSNTMPGSGYRTELTVAGYAGGDEVQKRLPVLVRVSPETITAFSYSKCLAGGADVFFATDADGLNRLACDIELWDTDGTSLVWVKMPEISGTDTKFYMFWGSGVSAQRPASTEVWSEYVGVWHMNSYDPETGVRDETGHGWNVTNIYNSTTGYSVTTLTNSPFCGNALNLTRGLEGANYDDYMLHPTNGLPDSLTISCWFKKPDGVGSYNSIMRKFANYGSASLRCGYVEQIYDTRVNYMKLYYGNSKASGSAALNADSCPSFVANWNYLVYVAANNTIAAYVNGASKSSNSTTSPVDSIGKASAAFKFGGEAMPLQVDEARITRIPRSAKWVKAEYDSMNNANFIRVDGTAALSTVVQVDTDAGVEYGSGEIAYGFDEDVAAGTPKTYTAPATVAISEGRRAVCTGWTLSVDGVSVRDSTTPNAGENDTTCIVTPSGFTVLQWHWKTQSYISVASSDALLGSVTGDGWQDDGTMLTVTAVPTAQGRFAQWEGDVSLVGDVFEDEFSFEVDSPVSFRARFGGASDCIFTCETSGTVDFYDETYWQGGVVPSAGSAVVFTRPPEGVSVTVNVTNALDLARLDVGFGPGAGSIELELGCGLATNRVAGDVVLREGATLTHTCHGTADNAKKYALNLEVGGDVTIEEGASINVTAKGYYYGMGPMPAEGTAYMGAGYGGTSQGGFSSSTYAISPRKCFGSIRRPDEPGSGGGYSGSYNYGGGVIHLSVTNGTLTLNGSISANGGDTTHSSPAGGSVWIECGTLVGSGGIDACAGRATNYSHGGGGRIAVRQYLANDISAYTGLMRAGRNPVLSENYNGYHSVGSIYVENANDAEDRGELIAQGYDSISAYAGMACRLDDAIVDIDVPFGKVSVKNYARLEIPSGVTLKVEKGISVTGNGDFHTVAGGGAIEMMPGEDGAFSVEGLVKAYGIYCTNSPGATISFAAGAELRNLENGSIELRGTEQKPLALLPESADGTWAMNIIGPYADLANFEYVSVSNSLATGVSPTAFRSVNLGGNDNWGFLSGEVPEGTLFTWTGGSDTRWNNPGNWDVGIAPRNGDSLRIPSGLANYPVFDGADHYMCSVTIENGATITLSGSSLLVSNAFYSAGTIVYGGNRIGVFGDGDTVLDIASGTAENVYVEKAGGTLTLPTGFAADKFYCVTSEPLQFFFGAGEEFEFAQCNIESRGAAPHVLRSTVSGEEWMLSLTANQRVRNVTVSDSDASGGVEVKVSTAFATDAGNNTNWNFGGSIVEWIAGSGSWATAANWSTGEVPGENDDVFIAPASGTVTVTASAAVNIRSLTLGGTDAKVNLTSAHPVNMSGDLVLGDGVVATLSSKNTPNAIGGNVLMKSGSEMKHASNAKTFAYRLYMTVDGNMTIESGAKIELTGLGFEKLYGPENNVKNNADSTNGGGHGSTLSYNSKYVPCNDSIFEPILPGAGGSSGGAGAVYLDVDGDLTVDGEINVRSHRGTNACGAPGAICLKVGTLKGTGLVTAAPAPASATKPLNCWKGGAGRIAIYQRRATDWTPSASVTITTQNNDNDGTHGGTIYKELPGDGHHGGTIYIEGRQNVYTSYGTGFTQLPMADDGDPRRAYSRATLVIGSGANIRMITNETFTAGAAMKVKDLVFEASNPYLTLYNVKIYVMTLPHKDGSGWTGGDYASRVSAGRIGTGGSSGGIEWNRYGMTIHVR